MVTYCHLARTGNFVLYKCWTFGLYRMSSTVLANFIELFLFLNSHLHNFAANVAECDTTAEGKGFYWEKPRAHWGKNPLLIQKFP